MAIPAGSENGLFFEGWIAFPLASWAQLDDPYLNDAHLPADLGESIQRYFQVLGAVGG
jgi:hypothetical protein